LSRLLCQRVELITVFRITKYLVFLLAFSATSLPNGAFAQWPGANSGPATRRGAGDIHIYVMGADGSPIDVPAVVTLVAETGQVLRQGTTLGGNVEFSRVAISNCSIQVVAPGYETFAKQFRLFDSGTSTIIVDMQPASSAKGPVSTQMLLAPKVQKELGKALEALRMNKPEQARSHLEAAYGKAPNHPSVNYLYGVYFLEMKDQEKAKSCWAKALEFDPKHLSALLALSEALVREQKLSEAETYVKRAVDADPNSWRAHAILADVLLNEHLPAKAIQEAGHALELGHGQAAVVEPLLARALAEEGNKERAVKVLKEYVHDHPKDVAASKQLESLQAPDLLVIPAKDTAPAEVKPSTATETAISLPLPSNWLPPDVDENVPPVEPGVACTLDEVVQQAGKRVEEFLTNVDRFAASESLKHESIDKWGVAESRETRRFDYVVSIEQYRPGYFDVIEYRTNKYAPVQFPEGVETRGLPSMALIFHPNSAGNFAMSCEGLGRWNGTPAWQVHFRQRPDRPNTVRAYKIGAEGPSYRVALRGRAWIAADSYQIVRIETDLVSPLPEIRLFVDHTMVEYGPVRFKNRDVEMWLPQSAEVYSDWRGKRMHRRHSFSDYMLFSVDEKQRISDPQMETKNQAKK
jgi:tetratricopeptide (TPR) repeat protein